MAIYGDEITLKSFSARALPWTPLEEFAMLPTPPSWMVRDTPPHLPPCRCILSRCPSEEMLVPTYISLAY